MKTWTVNLANGEAVVVHGTSLTAESGFLELINSEAGTTRTWPPGNWSSFEDGRAAGQPALGPAPAGLTIEEITACIRAAANPIRIYDAETDTFRAAIQADVDRMQAQLQAFGKASMAMKAAVEAAKAV